MLLTQANKRLKSARRVSSSHLFDVCIHCQLLRQAKQPHLPDRVSPAVEYVLSTRTKLSESIIMKLYEVNMNFVFSCDVSLQCHHNIHTHTSTARSTSNESRVLSKLWCGNDDCMKQCVEYNYIRLNNGEW